jgi:hypothetical protein
MYSIYTLRSVKVRWIPFKPYIMVDSSQLGVVNVNYKPSYSVFDSDNSGPTNPAEFLAHSYKQNAVCQVHGGEQEHHRSIGNCTKILHQIENKQYFETNAQWSNREEIPTAAGLMYYVVSPYAGANVADDFG